MVQRDVAKEVEQLNYSQQFSRPYLNPNTEKGDEFKLNGNGNTDYLANRGSVVEIMDKF